jgi:hypothetical protein
MRHTSVTSLLETVYGILGGEDWGQQEAALKEEKVALSELRARIGNALLAKELSEKCGELAQASVEQRVVWFTNSARKALGVGSNWDAEFALRLASDPGSVRGWAKDDRRLAGGVQFLAFNRAFARAARFLALAVHRHLGGPSGDEQLYTGWEWT